MVVPSRSVKVADHLGKEGAKIPTKNRLVESPRPTHLRHLNFNMADIIDHTGIVS
jgi:hypothetical protein